MIRTLFLAAAAMAPLLTCAAEPSADLPQVPSVTIAAERDSEWIAYRDAYKGVANIAKYTRSRPLIQAHMQIRPRQLGLSLDGLRIVLAGATTQVDIPVDGVGRAVVPLLKNAYDEDAVLRLNRRVGHFRFSGRFSIKQRADGVYEAAQLRAACEQLISAQREHGSRFRLIGKTCAGIKFVYAPGDRDAAIEVRDGQRVSGIEAVVGEPFESQPIGTYMVATYRFDSWPAQGTVVAPGKLLAIGTLYE